LDFFHLRSNSETAIAYFSFDQMDNTVQFQNESWRETEVSWNFGDGNFSNELNPLHEYTSNGIFTVDLIASNECGDDTISVQIEVSGVGLNDLMTGYKLKSLGEHQYVLEGMDQHSDVSIYELSGKEVALDITKKDKSSVEFDLSSLRTGMYILMNKELRIKLIR
ncbi:MAG: PKD domain-containing protein, partial [Bacteroidetes bacterium]